MMGFLHNIDVQLVILTKRMCLFQVSPRLKALESDSHANSLVGEHESQQRPNRNTSTGQGHF